MPKNLLLADDSITIQKVVGITFANEDFKVTSVDNGEDAISKARELKPDVILADVVMPRKNGYEVCEAVKGDPSLRHIPVLLLAGTFEAFDEGRARQARADGHIAKPFESQALINKVREVTGKGGGAAAPRPAAPQPQPQPQPQPAGFRPGAPLPPPPGARPPGPGMPPGPARPGAPFPPGVRPPGPVPPGMARPQAPGQPRPGAPMGPGAPMPPGARPLAPGMAPGQPRPGAPMPPYAARPPGGAMPQPPQAARPGPAPAARPAPPQAAPTRPAAPAAPIGRKDPFGFGLGAPEPAAPAPAAPGREEDFGDLEVEPPKPAERPASAAASMAIELPEDTGPEPELAPMHAFVPPPEQVGHRPAPSAAPSAPAAGDGGEALLRDALSKASREVIEKVVWEVVPQLAETIIRENLDRLVKQR